MSSSQPSIILPPNSPSVPLSTPVKNVTPIPTFREESPEPSAPSAIEMEPLPSPVAHRTRSQKQKIIMFEESGL